MKKKKILLTFFHFFFNKLTNLLTTHQDTIVFLNKPSLSVFFGQFVAETNSRSTSSSLAESSTWSSKDNEEVHTEDTDGRVVFDAQIDVLLDTESEGTSFGKVVSFQFVLFDFQARFQDFFGFGASDGDSTGDLFVSSNTESSAGQSSLREDGGLTGQSFQNFGGSGQSITGFTDTDVETEFVDSNIPHGVSGGLFLGHFSFSD